MIPIRNFALDSFPLQVFLWLKSWHLLGSQRKKCMVFWRQKDRLRGWICRKKCFWIILRKQRLKRRARNFYLRNCNVKTKSKAADLFPKVHRVPWNLYKSNHLDKQSWNFLCTALKFTSGTFNPYRGVHNIRFCRTKLQLRKRLRGVNWRWLRSIFTFLLPKLCGRLIIGIGGQLDASSAKRSLKFAWIQAVSLARCISKRTVAHRAKHFETAPQTEDFDMSRFEPLFAGRSPAIRGKFFVITANCGGILGPQKLQKDSKRSLIFWTSKWWFICEKTNRDSVNCLLSEPQTANGTADRKNHLKSSSGPVCRALAVHPWKESYLVPRIKNWCSLMTRNI